MACHGLESCLVAALSLLAFISLFRGATQDSDDYPNIARLSNSWINVHQEIIYYSDEAVTVLPILDIESEGAGFCFGFCCRNSRDECLLAVVIYHLASHSSSVGYPRLVWSANRNTPVRVNATLQLTEGGDLILKDADGKFVWSSNTT